MMVDSGFWIALKYDRDKWHNKALEFKGLLAEADTIYVTDNIITETYNFLLRKVSYEAAHKTLVSFIQLPKIKILFNNSLILRSTFEVMKKHNHLSYTDANMVWHCNNMGIEKVLSFDSGFDQLDKVKRIG